MFKPFFENQVRMTVYNLNQATRFYVILAFYFSIFVHKIVKNLNMFLDLQLKLLNSLFSYLFSYWS